MRHGNKGKILDRKYSARRALIRSLATSLVLYEKIETTMAKAKALRPFIEKYVSAAKAGDLAARRHVLGFLYTENAAKKMMDVIGPKYKDRSGGYTRIIKLGSRLGDGASVARIEFV
ncbi:MAG: large subunit ribosomal protein L17 [Parcubacteria group bacterium Gr01-1014_18]|nr:MAG: large subunit ribosomal protein L17 [Parcubacteria group bacterium Greene0416_36]TSC80136.1 MAG: large subunit ribosomal protein L17 [Parcubacteria group bacterium Gr01-1014_18]TSC99350.1 MAG: large subunit ribosomal protein L17 [Parcubacteria group bacterium Greene1014_20]TSD06813.1 MAG: large subunit ribosomal protein L17 [Parcubacteria group bacterium Greene0714_2]